MVSERKEVVLVVDEGFFHMCRICHEEEDLVVGSTLETPCACSGTLKFAHRDCIQKWCDEKGSAVCEICLQNFEPDYYVAPKKALVDIEITIRGSVEVARQEYPSQSRSNIDYDFDPPQCSPSSERRLSCCRFVITTFAMVMLFKHLVSLMSVGAGYYSFTLVVVSILRAIGNLLPFYMIIRMISAAQQRQRQQRQQWRLYEGRIPTLHVVREQFSDVPAL